MALGVVACQQAVDAGHPQKLASGNLLSIGKEHLVMQSENHVMFVSVDEINKQKLLSNLKQGDKITLMGMEEPPEKGVKGAHAQTEVVAIVKEDGTRIALNH